MRLSFLLGAAIGYVLGARAGRQRYEDIVAVARRVAGSQTVQSTAGVIQAQVSELTSKARDSVAAKLPSLHVTHQQPTATTTSATNGRATADF
jgi:hypothetical protein